MVKTCALLIAAALYSVLAELLGDLRYNLCFYCGAAAATDASDADDVVLLADVSGVSAIN